MYQLIEQLLNTIHGVQINTDVLQILALVLTLNIAGLFLSVFKLKGNNWDFACKIIIAMLALMTLGGVTWSFSLA